MSKSVINGYSSWANVRLAREDCEASDITKGIVRGFRLKVFLRGTYVHVCMRQICPFLVHTSPMHLHGWGHIYILPPVIKLTT